MVLSDRDIKSELLAGRIVIEPLCDKNIQPASVDVCLGSNFRIFRNSIHTCIDPLTTQDGLTESIDVPEGEVFVLHPGQFALGTTLERIAIPDDILGKLEGKSTLGRLGLMIHSTAGYVDPGWDGELTLELSNVATLPIVLHPPLSGRLWGVFDTPLHETSKKVLPIVLHPPLPGRLEGVCFCALHGDTKTHHVFHLPPHSIP